MKFVSESFEFLHRGTLADAAFAWLDAFPWIVYGRLMRRAGGLPARHCPAVSIPAVCHRYALGLT
jgi:hypothetical protein